MARAKKKVTKKKRIVDGDENDFIDPKRLIPTGITTFNLACSNNYKGGPQTGKIINLIGDSSSGKTMVAFTISAEMVNDKRFKYYRIIYDDVEAALEFDVSRLFGNNLKKRIEPPLIDKDGNPVSSETILHFHDNILTAIEKKKPFIYILDSLDALDEKGDQKKLKEMRKSVQTGTEIKGSYGMGKAKGMSQLLRNICRAIEKTNSILIIISQTRDNTVTMSKAKNTRSGGRALKFYCTHEIWLNALKPITSKELKIGNNVKGKITKNKITGIEREFFFIIYYDYGIDDVQSNINFLLEMGYWKKKKLTIIANDFGIEGQMKKVIREIEDQNLERKLKRLVGKVWKEREDSVKLSHRKRKY